MEPHPLEGKRVRLIAMPDDPCPVEPGTEGTVDFVDAVETLHVNWDNGRRLGLIPDHDKWEYIS